MINQIKNKPSRTHAISSTVIAGVGTVLANALAPFERRSENYNYDLRDAFTTGNTVWTKAFATGLADVYPKLSPGMKLAKPLWVSRYIWSINTHRKKIVCVYINTYRLNDFFDLVLPHLTKRIVIICGDSVLQVFSQALDSKHLEDGFPSDRRVIAIFSQNLTTPHPRAFPLPIGIDFHSIHRGATTWGMPTGQTPQIQEDELLYLRQAAAPWSKRTCIVFVHYNPAVNILERSLCFQALAPLHMSYVGQTPLPRYQLWQLMAASKFVASPPGVGFDCHRTWEALALGSVPIIKRVPTMSPQFADLPVWEIDDYSEVTDETIAKKSHEICLRLDDNTYDWSKLTTLWWRKYVLTSTSTLS